MFRTSSIGRTLMLVATSAVAVLTSGCQQKVIDHVSFQVTPDGKNMSVALVFNKGIQSNLAGTFPIKNYGDLFVQQYTATQPFELGFTMNTAVVNDNDYIHLQPTSYLPNGVPLGIPYGLVEIQGANPISSSFDLSGYIDIQHQAWFGTAATFSFINDKSFPPGMAIEASFAQDAQGNPGILAYVFGASLNPDGTLKRPGGIAVLANVKQLAGISAKRGGGNIDLSPNSEIAVRGQDATRYSNPKALMGLQDQFIRLMNRH